MECCTIFVIMPIFFPKGDKEMYSTDFKACFDRILVSLSWSVSER